MTFIMSIFGYEYPLKALRRFFLKKIHNGLLFKCGVSSSKGCECHNVFGVEFSEQIM